MLALFSTLLNCDLIIPLKDSCFFLAVHSILLKQITNLFSFVFLEKLVDVFFKKPQFFRLLIYINCLFYFPSQRKTIPKLSDQRVVVKDGTVPLPLYTCVHVKNDVSAQLYNGKIADSAQ